MSARRQFLELSLGSLLLPSIAATLSRDASAATQPSSSPAPSNEANIIELGPENAAMAPHTGLWDVTETVWGNPGAAPTTTTGLVAERRMIGPYLQEFIRPAADSADQNIKRIDYLSFQRVEGRWKYVSMELRVAVGVMPAYSFDRGSESGIVLQHDAFALPAGVLLAGSAPQAAGQMLRMTTTWTRSGPDRDVKDQHFAIANGSGVVWLAHRYAYSRRG
jgi:hypothetical protein